MQHISGQQCNIYCSKVIVGLCFLDINTALKFVQLTKLFLIQQSSYYIKRCMNKHVQLAISKRKQSTASPSLRKLVYSYQVV